MTLEEMKMKIIASVKQNYSANVIYAAYPVYEQLNNIRSGGAAMTDMGSVIDGWRGEIESVETIVNALADTALLDNFTASNDADDSNYVASVLTDLTTDEQKLYVACALRFLKV